MTLKKLLVTENPEDVWTKFIPPNKFERRLGLIDVCNG